MRKLNAYKLDSTNSDNTVTILIDFSLGDQINSHRYYLISSKNSYVDIKRVSSIDDLVGFADRNNLVFRQLQVPETKMLYEIMHRYVELREFYSIKNKDYKDDLDYPGVSNLIDYDLFFLNDFFNFSNVKYDNHEMVGGSNGKK